MRLLKILGIILLGAVAALGQTNKGGISGTVVDPNGAAVPGATITITNLGTNQSTTVKSSDDGAFSVTSLDPVTYRVGVEAQGFKKSVIESLKVDTAQTASVNVQLETGAIAEQVTVAAEAAMVNTETGTTAQTITQRQIQDVPLVNRSVLDLALTAPGVSGDVGSEDPNVTSGQPVPGYNLNVNGGRSGSTTILADGVNNTGVGIARAVVSFTPETVQEFTVQTSAFSAEFGQTAGGVINATTKSGTNKFNGVALWYTRNPKFNAQQWQIGTAPRNPNNLRYNQVSISLGGPVILPRFGEGGKSLWNGKDRTFFFFAYEPRWRRDFLNVTTLLPTLRERAGDFTNLVRSNSGWLPADVAAQFNQSSVGPTNIYQQFFLSNGKLLPVVLTGSNILCQFNDPRVIPTTITTGPQCPAGTTPNPALNVIPQQYIDPTALKLLQYMPAPGSYFVDASGLVRNAIIQRFVQQDETRYTLRLDHNFTNNFKGNFRYTVTPAIGIRGFASDVNGNTAAYSDARQMLLAFNNIISPTVVNDLRLNYTRGVFSEDFSPEFSINGGRNLANELGLNSLTTGGIPLFQITSDANGYNAFANIGSSGSTNNYNVEERFNISDIVYWSRGNQTWKMGVDLSNARLTVQPFFAASGGRWDFRTIQTSAVRNSSAVGNGGNPFASLLLGVPNQVSIRPLLLKYYYRWNAGAAFFQDDWKVRPNLTLNLGLRYSLQYPRSEKNNLQGVIRPDLAVTQTLTPAQRVATAIGLGLLPTGSPATTPVPDVVPTSVLIPPFAFAGRGGRSKYLVPVDYWGIEPRFGFAYSPKMRIFGINLEEKSVVLRGGYGISHAALTGNNRLPTPDFSAFVNVNTLNTGTGGSTGTSDAAQPIRLTGNPVLFNPQDLFAVLKPTADGLVYTNSLGLAGGTFANTDVAGSGKVPYSQNWNLSLQFQPFKNTVIEMAYTGNKGTHLYLPLVNINPRNLSFIESLEAQNLSAEGTFADPLGRVDLSNNTVTIPRLSVGNQFFGFNTINRFFDPSANSIYHSAYIDIRRRVTRGLTFTANYRLAKSIDDASDASPDTRVITEVGQTQGQVSYGARRNLDRSISTFDIKNNFTATFLWDIPIGRNRWLLSNAPGVVNAVFGGWSMSGVLRMPGSYPFVPYLTDTNRLGGPNRTVRPNIVPGVPLKNPLWKRNCPVGNLCEPFINPAAFMRPPKGSLGNAPRTLDIRAPRQEYFDLSFQKNFPFPFGKSEKRRINFRVDLLNAFNHPNFRFANSSGTAGFTTLPTETTNENEPLPGGGTRPAVITAAEYNAWATANGQPLSTTTAGLAQLNAIRATINAFRLSSGGLPLNFFSVPVPQGFSTTNANTFDIRTVEGFKLWRLRNAFDPSFGTLREVNQPRYIQFGIRIFF